VREVWDRGQGCEGLEEKKLHKLKVAKGMDGTSQGVCVCGRWSCGRRRCDSWPGSQSRRGTPSDPRGLGSVPAARTSGTVGREADEPRHLVSHDRGRHAMLVLGLAGWRCFQRKGSANPMGQGPLSSWSAGDQMPQLGMASHGFWDRFWPPFPAEV